MKLVHAIAISNAAFRQLGIEGDCPTGRASTKAPVRDETPWNHSAIASTDGHGFFLPK
jgi:hypothetical protein